MEFRLLGSLAVLDKGHVVELRGAKERTLLALLLLHANQTVSTERVIDELWGDEAPPTAPKLVRTYVWHLRKMVGDIILTRPPGYAAAVPPGRRDLDRFEELVSRAQHESPPEAAATLRDALALWRGRPLEDVRFASFAQHEVDRLEDRRLSVVSQRIDYELALGRHETVVAELQALVASHPYRERFRAQLMLALYRSGRQADALEAYRDARRRFVEELGIEPGPELQRLERAILDHEPDLEAPPAVGLPQAVISSPLVAGLDRPERSTRERPAKPRRRARPRRIAVALGAAAAATAATLALASLLRDDHPGLAGIAPESVGLIDPETGEIVRAIRVGERPVALDAAAGTLWVANYADDTVTRIDERTGATDTIPVGGHPTALEADRNGVWVLQSDDRRLVRVDRRFGYRAGAPARSEATSLATARSSLWVTVDDTSLQRLDPRGRPRGDPLLLDAGARLLVGSDGTLWAAGPRAVTAVDARTGIPSFPTDLLGTATAITIGRGYVWVAVRRAGGRGLVQKIDAEEERAAAFTDVGSVPRAIAVAATSIWVAKADSTVARLRADDLSVAGVIRLGARPSALAAGEAGLWVAIE